MPFSKRPLACLLAFAAGSLISALAIELAYEGAQALHHHGYDARAAWVFVSAGFAAGAVIYYSASLFLEQKGAAVRYITQFREYAMARKQGDANERVELPRNATWCGTCPPSRSSKFCHISATTGSRPARPFSEPVTPATFPTSSRGEE
jgi:hypothetical protein